MSISTRPRAHSLQNKESLSTLTVEAATTSIVVMERDEHATIIPPRTQLLFCAKHDPVAQFSARGLTYLWVFLSKNAFALKVGSSLHVPRLEFSISM
jgi:hypothetical protein